jgi:hypothetical protein
MDSCPGISFKVELYFRACNANTLIFLTGIIIQVGYQSLNTNAKKILKIKKIYRQPVHNQ